jgi:thiol-disulfide isomerase/thioredoxin
VLIDPATNLMRQWSVDMKAALEKRGQQNVNRALLTIDYKTITPEAPAAKDAFAWAPPEGARDAAKMSAGPDEDEIELRKKLVGKAAPDFTLKDLDGKEVKLKDVNKDHVIVLDFWATWCGPCRVSLPVLQKVAEARKDKKLKVFVINLEEDKDTVAAFVKETKLTLHVLLDSNADVGKAYFADGIPETVIIGKDGKVKQAMIGVHDQKDLEKEIDEVLK